MNFLEEFGIRIHWEISFIFKELFDRKVKQILERFWAFFQSIKKAKRKWSNLTSPNLYELWIIYQYSIQNLLGNPAFQNWFLCTNWHTSSYMSHLRNVLINDTKLQKFTYTWLLYYSQIIKVVFIVLVTLKSFHWYWI